MDKTRIPLAEAERKARQVVGLLETDCTRVEIAGSIRRRRPDVGDIEIVCVPRLDYQPPQLDLFGNVVHQPPTNALDVLASRLVTAHLPTLPQELPGPLACPKGGECHIPQFGAIFTIRTGCAEFSHRLVTPRLGGGNMPVGMIEKGGVLWDRGRPLETPTEESFFDALSLPWLEPERRTPHVTLLRNSANGEGRWV